MKRLLIILALFFSLFAPAQTGILGVIRSAAPVTFYDLTNAKIIYDGDSYLNGEQNRIMSLAPFNTNGATFVEYAVGGQQVSQMLADQESEIYPALVPGVLNIVAISGPGNSLYYDADAGTHATSVTQTMNETKLYVSNLRAEAARVGATVLVISNTLIPRDNAELGTTKNAIFAQLIQDYNVALLADHDWLDGIYRPELEAMFATFESVGYDPDRVHPSTPTGYDKMAELKRDLILQITGN